MATQTSSLAQLDHVIILVPHAALLKPPSWITSNFTLTPGGRHADNKTENTLILFADGSYIELIAFIGDDPALKEGHWWGKKKPGIIDFALTTPGEAGVNYEAVQHRLEALKHHVGADYARPVAGGRKRPDGQDIKWQVTFPQGVERGELPFFCHDVTARELRVPCTEESTTHPCGAYGVKRLVVQLPSESARKLAETFGAILGGEASETGEGDVIRRFGVGRVEDVPGTAPPAIAIQRAPSREVALLSELVLGVSKSRPDGSETLDEQYRIVLEPGLPPV